MIEQGGHTGKNMLASIVKKASAEAGVGLSLTEVPKDLLGAKELHLKPWSMLVTDKTLVAMTKQNHVSTKSVQVIFPIRIFAIK